MKEPSLSLLQAIRAANVLPMDARFVVAVSGGADSLALLHLYTRARSDFVTHLLAATFDHGLRGDQGRDDALFVADTVAAWGVRCVFGSAAPSDVGAAGVEARARTARYHFLARTARDFGANYVITAHHADDQAETVLLNLLRGAGLRGMGGMRPVAPLPDAPDITLLRPLLGVHRAELEAYCRAEGIPWREDPTNADVRFRRNWVRHAVLPLLREANPEVAGALARTAALAHEEDAYLDDLARLRMAAGLTAGPDWVWLNRADVLGWPPVIRRRALILAARTVSAAFEPDYARIEAALRLLDTPEGGTMPLGGVVDVRIDSGFMAVTRRGSPWQPPYAGPWLTGADEDIFLSQADAVSGQINVTVRAPVTARITMGPRRAGERVFPDGLKGRSQTLKDYLINRKVPRLLRDHLPIIRAESQVLALWDGRDWHAFSPPFDVPTVAKRVALP